MGRKREHSRAPTGEGWNRARQTAATAANSHIEAKALLDAIAFFEAEFGGNWPGWDRRYPLATTFFFAVDTNTASGVELHQHLLALGPDPARNEILGHLKSSAWEQFAAARMVLDLAARARRAGIEVQLLRAPGKIIADLRLRLVERWIRVECVALHESDTARNADRVLDEFLRWTTALGVEKLGRLHVKIVEQLPPSKILERLSELKACIERAVRADTADFLIDGLAAVSFRAGLPALPVPIEGVGEENLDRDVERLRLRIRQKSKQLVGPDPSLLVARTRYLFAFEPFRLEMQAATLKMLEEELTLLPAVSAAVVYETWLGADLPSQGHRGDRFAILEGPDGPGRSRVAVFLAGATPTTPFSLPEVAAFIGEHGFW